MACFWENLGDSQPPPGPRNATLWPFASSSAFNRPIGSGASGNYVDHPAIRSMGANINRTSHSIVLSISQSSFPLVHITFAAQCDAGVSFPALDLRIESGVTGADPQACPRDGFLNVISTDGYAYGFQRFNRTGTNAGTANRHQLYSHDHVLTGVGYPSSDGFQGRGHWVSGFNIAAGVMRKWELQEVADGNRLIFNHVLMAALPREILKDPGTGGRSATYRWPASYADNSYTQQTGTVLMGSLLAIQPSLDIEAQSWTDGAKVLARTLQRYGAYVGATAGGGLKFYAEASGSSAVVSQMLTNIDAIRDNIRVIDNNSPTAIGGGGAYPLDIWPIPDPLMP